MRILFDAHHLGEHQTGNETWARNMLRHLPSSIPEAELHVAVTARGAASVTDLVGDAPTHVVSRSSVRRVTLDLPATARRIRPHVILTQYQMALTRTPAVVLVHDISAEHSDASAWLPWRTRMRYRMSSRSSARWAARLLTVSSFTRDEMHRRYGVAPSKIAVAPNAVDPVLAEHLRGLEARPVPGLVLSVGNVLPRKNLVIVARALRRLLDDGHDVRFRVAGQVPPEGRSDAESVKRLLADRVEFTGYVTTERLAACYKEAAVLAFPSLYEGFGVPVLEAMSAGTPVAVSDHPALVEVAGQAGEVVPARSETAWKQALARLLSDSRLRSERIAAGAERARHYDWDASAAIVAATLRAAAVGRELRLPGPGRRSRPMNGRRAGKEAP